MPASLNKIASSIALDQWEDLAEDVSIFNPTETGKVVVLKTDPLYFVCSQVRQGKAPFEIFPFLEELFNEGASEDILQENITPEDVMTAATIRRHYKNKYMMNRLKDKPLGKYEHALDKMLENEKFLDRENIRILVKLPEFYTFELTTEELFAKHQSVQKPRNRSHELDGIFKFAGSVAKNTLKKKYTAFYWTAPDNTLAVITVDHLSKGLDCWRYLAEQGEVGIRAKVNLGTMIGGDFLVYQLGNKYELFDPEDK